jgi:hypothetical protein
MAREFSKRRRSILKRAALAIGAVMAGAATIRARSQSDEKVSESDPLAKQLMYVEDASKASSSRTAGAFCYNCRFFESDQQTGYAPCLVFSGKLVNAQGWCVSWSEKQAG